MGDKSNPAVSKRGTQVVPVFVCVVTCWFHVRRSIEFKILKTVGNFFQYISTYVRSNPRLLREVTHESEGGVTQNFILALYVEATYYCYSTQSFSTKNSERFQISKNGISKFRIFKKVP